LAGEMVSDFPNTSLNPWIASILADGGTTKMSILQNVANKTADTAEHVDKVLSSTKYN
jgi:hypothetical protein